MANVHKSVLVFHSARQMFDLVDQVEHYPDFLPWCGGAQVEYGTENEVLATVKISYLNVNHSFTTLNRRQAPHVIEMKLKDGPFSKLDGAWHFIELAEDACKVEFRLNYEFSSKLMEKVIGPVFNKIANGFVEAFIRQAERKYGAS